VVRHQVLPAMIGNNGSGVFRFDGVKFERRF
jgi:hypothetical protein